MVVRIRSLLATGPVVVPLNSGATVRISAGVSLRVTPPPTNETCPIFGCGTSRFRPRC